jgi:adenosylhomocysteine nucleosidase
MWLRLLVGQLVQQAATQKMRSMVTDAVQGQLEPGEAAPLGPCEIAFIFALNAESGALTDLLESSTYAKCPTFVERAGLLDGRPVVVAEVGVGAEAAARGTADCLALHKPKWVVSAGFAGGLAEGLNKGHILMADELVDPSGNVLETGLKIDRSSLSPSLHVGRLLTVDHLIREPDEKRSLAQQHNAVACDMESFAVAEVCRQVGVPFFSVRVISDTVDDRLPIEIEKLLTEKSLAGRLGTAAGAILNRFSAIGDMWRLYEDALKCSKRLANFLRSMLPQMGG